MIKIQRGECNLISNCTKDELEQIKEDLTLVNPAYLQAERYSGYDNIRIPKHLLFYQKKGGIVKVPSGYMPNLPYELENDHRIEVTIKYPPIKIELRDDQRKAYYKYLEDTDKGIICLPTGKGKSILGIYIAYALKQRTLVIVHKDDLVVGWTKDIKDCFANKLDVGLIKASSRKVCPITIATIQTLSRMKDEELKRYTKLFGLVIVDECHRAPSSSYDILESFPSAYKIGLSATPERKDGLNKIMSFHFGGFAYKYINKGGEDKDILSVDIIRRDDLQKYTPKVVRKGRVYKINDAEGVSIDEIRNPRIIFSELEDVVIRSKSFYKMYFKDIMKEYNEGHSCLVLVRLKDQCRYIASVLNEKYNLVEGKDYQLYYGDSKENKSTLIDRAEKQRQLITIATLSVATEGTNVKQWEVVFLLASISDGKNLEQAIGRVRRRTKLPKLDRARIYDYRHPHTHTLRNHTHCRETRYRKLKLEKRELFSRGYN